MGLAAVGADVLGRGQSLPQKAEQHSARLARVTPCGHGRPLHGEYGSGDQGDVCDPYEPDTPVLVEQDDQDSDRQEAIAHQADDHLREKAGQRGHVPVDPFDELSGRVHLVKGHIEPKGVQGQIATQRVRRCPSDRLAQVGRGHGQGLVHDGYAQVDQGGDGKLSGDLWTRVARPGDHGVDEDAHDLGADQL